MRAAFAPYRVSLFGGGTDYPEWYIRKGGIAVNFTMDKGIRVEVTEDEDELTRLAIAENGAQALKVKVQSDFARETGLGGSAAYAIALAVALQGKEPRDKLALAKYGFDLERGVGRVVGMQDHLAAAFGAHRVWWFRNGEGAIENEYLQIQKEEMADFCSHMMLLPVPRSEKGSQVAERYKGANMEGTYQRALQGLAALEKKDWEKVGYELQRSWDEKKKWAPGVSVAGVDLLVDTANRMGAWGCKLLGAGGGGMVLIMAEDTQTLYERILRRGFKNGRYGVYPGYDGAHLCREGEEVPREGGRGGSV